MSERKPMRPRRDERRIQLGRIHMAKKWAEGMLGMDDESYRSLLRRVTGKSSSADMTAEQRNLVIAEFARLGFKVERQESFRRIHAGRPKGNLSEQLEKVEALLTDAKRPWAYAHSMARRMYRADRVEWCRPEQLQGVIAALTYDARRRKRAEVSR